MKSFFRICIFSVVLFGLSAVSHAQEKGMMCPISGKMMGGKGCGMACKACPMHGMMMDKCASSHSIIPTSDGGIIVTGCGKLTKYDKNLKLVKEIARTDQQECMGKMKAMMKNCPMCAKKSKCPMCAKMKGKEMMDETAAEAEAEDPAP